MLLLTAPSGGGGKGGKGGTSGGTGGEFPTTLAGHGPVLTTLSRCSRVGCGCIARRHSWFWGHNIVQHPLEAGKSNAFSWSLASRPSSSRRLTALIGDFRVFQFPVCLS